VTRSTSSPLPSPSRVVPHLRILYEIYTNNLWAGVLNDPGNGTSKTHMREESSVWRFIQAGDFRIDPEAFGVSIGSHTVHLTPKEFKLLLYLAKRTARAVTHQRLIQAIWGVNTSGERERLRDTGTGATQEDRGAWRPSLSCDRALDWVPLRTCRGNLFAPADKK
jgi:hypothetical protein